MSEALPENRTTAILTSAALVAANLVPLAGVFFLNWDVASILILYWAENLIIGFYNILKMALARVRSPQEHFAKLFMIPFFCVHYGGFCAGHGFFLVMLLNIGAGGGAGGMGAGTPSFFPSSGGEWWGPLIFMQLLFNVVGYVWSTLPPNMIWPLIGLFVSHGFSFVMNFLRGEERRDATLQKLMGQPYVRIFIMHVAIIAGAFGVMALKSPKPLLVILIVLKIGMDLYLHNREHQRKVEAEEVGVYRSEI